MKKTNFTETFIFFHFLSQLIDLQHSKNLYRTRE